MRRYSHRKSRSTISAFELIEINPAKRYDRDWKALIDLQ